MVYYVMITALNLQGYFCVINMAEEEEVTFLISCYYVDLYS